MAKAIKPMLATLVREPFDRDGWFFEVKWDGYRAIAEITRGTVKLYSRNGLSFNKRYPAIVEALESAENDAIFDGEIIALPEGRPDFHALQNYDEKKVPLQFVVFDILALDGRSLKNETLARRKELLKTALPRHPLLVYGEHVEGEGRSFFKSLGEQGLEGMVAKDSLSPYREGERGESWLKVKHWQEQEAVIIGFTAPRRSRKEFGALVLGAYDNGKLVYIGHSGGGFTDKELRDLRPKLEKITVAKPPLEEEVPVNSPITWVKPKFVCQIKFAEWTKDGRMRHPVYAGLRLDKSVKEVIRERKETAFPSEIAVLKAESKHKKSTGASAEQSFTNLDKIFWPDEGYTKGDVIAYYERMAAAILPYLADRPQSLNRHPNGISGQSFYQKNIAGTVPPFVETKKIWSESNQKDIRYLVCQNKATLLYLANLGCIELNVWNSRIRSLDKPDYMIIDLDPGDNTWDELIEVARVAHDVLDDACQEHYIKTSGKTGLHILIPLGAKYTYGEIREFIKLLAYTVHQRIPEITSVERSPAKRKKKIYIDYLQNRQGQTLTPPYSLRPWPGATVSTPLLWAEVKKGLNPNQFTIRSIEKRLEKIGDIWKPVIEHAIDLKESIRCLAERLERDKRIRK